RLSSDEVSPAVAAIADTAAMPAGCGRIDKLSMRGSPSITFPTKTKQQGGMRFLLFSHDAVRPNPNPTSDELFGGRNLLFLLMFSSKSQSREPDSWFAH